MGSNWFKCWVFQPLKKQSLADILTHSEVVGSVCVCVCVCVCVGGAVNSEEPIKYLRTGLCRHLVVSVVTLNYI